MTRLRLVTTLGLAVLLIAGLATAHVPAARAQPGAAPSAGYSLTWLVVAAGGGASSGGSYNLTGTAGQPGAGALSGGSYVLAGGFWGSLGAALHDLFLPLLRR